MLPKDIVTIIDNYNEEGIILLIGDSFYWFNGKQCEFFVKAPKDINRFLWYEGRLYFMNGNNILNILRMNKFVEFDGFILNNYYNMLRLFRDRVYDSIVDKNNRVYLNAPHVKKLGHCHTNLINFNGSRWESIIKKNNRFCGKQFLIYNEIIYYFARVYNEKFDIEKNEWTPFANPNFKFGVMYLFEDKFYNINASHQIVYDPITDKWSRSSNPLLINK